MMIGWSGGLGLPTIGSPPEQERPPPPPPTKIDFPVYDLLDVPGDASESSLREIADLLASIRRPQDLSTEKLKAFNLRMETNITADRIVPQGSKLFPPLPWEARVCNETEDGEPILMDNGNPYPAADRFEILKKELLLDNDDAFREVTRLPPKEGRQRVRVANARKFWMGLERMSQWWDSSLDNYFERPAIPEEASNEDKMQTDGEPQPSGIQESTTTPMEVDSPPTTQTVDGTSSDPEEGQQPTVQRYTGRRIGNGQEMPEDVREETVRALAEMAAWPFGCQVTVPMLPPRLTVKKILFPIRQSFQAARSPKDRQLARNGVMEGPVFVAQCRPETSFRGPGDAPGTGVGEVCDLFRELGAMLLAAQERARQGTTEVKAGEGKWWATKPRWGGATQDTQDNSNCEDQSVRDGNDRKRSKYEHPFVASRRPGSGRKLSNAEKWKIVQPGPSLWDKRMRYIQIGKDKDSPFDDIYMLSSINHHVAILHLRIHRRYLDLLTTGESDFTAETDTPDQTWQVLKLRRTKWYDLFDAQERLEVFQGVWTMFHYLLRKQ
ncbi:hypothetical protein KXX16_003244 [Aspergillus fumigatus]|uniref:Uncharacterized protein n=1 Tax=Aspergillus fumigatus TaxID=746128 RepID=A0A8H4I444_ASPFM|nr:hypothetical protein CNMCM8689_002558 [Aspergillus fumigatus]KAF4288859.1 hypothetical protein CNMCM8686_003497 [Aspergillus fumigatus]KAH1314094.1 hypothetical protein KXX38_003495 [Aspergillus fumigatus]KAH1315072.1 hypothetical protein KXX47_003671 [Aspergillus fumigatus]KAH1348254.1 hypothetical protein KXX14_003455 [Aspergillus fumigatus]